MPVHLALRLKYHPPLLPRFRPFSSYSSGMGHTSESREGATVRIRAFEGGGTPVVATLLPAAGRTTSAHAGSINLGFLTILHEPGGYLGGYLVTNSWGRPLEFRLSSAVQPSRVQQVLYAATLEPFLCADLIGKTLVEKASVPAHLIVTDREPALQLREHVAVPVIWLAPPELPSDPAAVRVPASNNAAPLLCAPRHPADASRARSLLDRIDDGFDLAEPFARVREAIVEARKLGAAQPTSTKTPPSLPPLSGAGK